MSAIQSEDCTSLEQQDFVLDSTQTKDADKNKTKMSSHTESWRSCCFNNMLPFSCYYGMVGLMTSALGAYLTSQVSTLEKQFGLSSSEIGLVLSMNDAGFLITVLFASYFGRNAHIPRILAVCGLVYGVSAFICVIPHFLTYQDLGDLNVDINTTQNMSLGDTNGLCSPERLEASQTNNLECSEEDKRFTSAKSIAMGMISLGMFLQGIVKAPRQPLSQTYIDDNVPKTKSGVHIGIIVGLSVLGPAVSFGVGGWVSEIYVTLEDTEMTPRDPRWIGAWWLGYILFGSLALLFSAPLLLFPRGLDNAPPREDNPDSKSERKKLSLKTIIRLIKGVLLAFLRLGRRPVWVLLVVASSVRMFAVSSIVAFMPKYMQIHYGLSIFKANLSVGFVGIGAAAAAILLSGGLARVLKLELRGMIRTIIIAQCISSFIFFGGTFLQCPQLVIQDIEIHTSHLSAETLSLRNTSCFHDCHCDGETFFPICGSDDVTYFSPCHAGCQTRTEQGYSDCLCIANSTTSREGPVLDAVPGTCQQECPLYISFLVISFFSSFISGLAGVPVFLSLLRSVDEKDKALALGVNSFLSSLIGWFLGPIVMGAVIDTTCTLWNRACSEDGSCALYDIVDLRYKLHGVDMGVSGLYILLYILAYLCLICRKSGNLYVTENKEEEFKPPTKE